MEHGERTHSMQAAHGEHEQHAGHEAHAGHDAHAGHAGHDKHAGHDPEAFRRKFWLSLVLTIPIVLTSDMVMEWFGYMLDFPGIDLVGPVLGTVVFFYGGWPFLAGAVSEIRDRAPATMLLISMAITVAYVASRRVAGLRGLPLRARLSRWAGSTGSGRPLAIPAFSSGTLTEASFRSVRGCSSPQLACVEAEDGVLGLVRAS